MSQTQFQSAARLYRDNLRFKFLSDEGNAKPVLPENTSGTVSITPTLQLIRERTLRP